MYYRSSMSTWFFFFNFYQDMVMRASSECTSSHNKCSRGWAIFVSCAISSHITKPISKRGKFQSQQDMFCCSSNAWLVWYEYVLARAILFGSFTQSGYEVRKLNDLIKDEDVCISLDGSDFVRLGKSSFRTWLTRGALACVSCWLTNRHLQRAVRRAAVVVQWTWTTISQNCGKALSIFICCQSSHFHSCIGLIAFCCTFLVQKIRWCCLIFHCGSRGLEARNSMQIHTFAACVMRRCIYVCIIVYVSHSTSSILLYFPRRGSELTEEVATKQCVHACERDVAICNCTSIQDRI